MRRALLAAGLALAAQAALAAPPLEARAFTREAASRLSAKLDEKVDIIAALQLSRGGSERISLGRIHAFCVANPADCEAELETFLTGLADSIRADTDAVDSRLVRIIIRDRAYADAVVAQSEGGITTWPVGNALSALLVIDAPTFVRSVTRGDLAAIGMDADAAFTAALANGRDNDGPLAGELVTLGPGEVGVLNDSYFSSSLLLPHGDWAPQAATLRGPLLAMVPVPDTLLYADGADAEAVDLMRREALRLANSSARPLSLGMLRWTPAGWVDHTE